MKVFRKVTSEWAWRILCTALLILNLWAKVNYVSRDDYVKDKKDRDDSYAADKKETAASIARIENILTKIEEENKVNDRQDEGLRDHESRIRALEARPH